MENDRVYAVLATPEKSRFHKLPSQPTTAKPCVSINIEYVAPTRALADHVGGPIHQPETGAGRN